MADLSKVIAGLGCCADLDRSCERCPYEGAEYCEVALMKDVLELLRSIPRKCPECKHRDNYCWTEPCLSCVVGFEKNAQPSNWRWKHGNG